MFGVILLVAHLTPVACQVAVQYKGKQFYDKYPDQNLDSQLGNFF